MGTRVIIGATISVGQLPPAKGAGGRKGGLVTTRSCSPPGGGSSHPSRFVEEEEVLRHEEEEVFVPRGARLTSVAADQKRPVIKTTYA